MQQFKEFRPTPFDSAGLNAGDQGNWLILLGHNRDSKIWEESNFDYAVKTLKAISPEAGENEEGSIEGDWQIHRFGHWACGWLEILIVRPGSPAHDAAVKMRADLERYPLLDEDDFSDREYTAKGEYWEGCDYEDRKALVIQAGLPISKARCKSMPQDVDQYINLD